MTEKLGCTVEALRRLVRQALDRSVASRLCSDNNEQGQVESPFVEVAKIVDTDTLTVDAFIDDYYVPRWMAASLVPL